MYTTPILGIPIPFDPTNYGQVFDAMMAIDSAMWSEDGLALPGSAYINFDTPTGASGYGFRDNAGTIQVKNFGGAWVNIPTSGTTYWTLTGSDIYFNTGKVGINDSSPDHTLDVGGNIGLSASGYINWDDTDGSGGYGFRDNSGTIQVKNSGGSWVNIPTSSTTQWTTSGSDIYYDTGKVGIGTSGTISAKLHALATTEQLRIGYDASNYTSFVISSGGDLTLTPSGGDITLNATLSIPKPSIGSTSTDALVLENVTAAAAGAQQWSGRVRWTGRGWKTNATAASRTVDFLAELVPVQGAANPSGYLSFSSQVNAGGYSNVFAIGADGNIGIGTVTPDAKLTVLVSGSLPTVYNAGDVATFIPAADGFSSIALVRGGVANPQGLHFGINHASHYSEIRASQDGIGQNTLVLNRVGGNVGIGTTTASALIHGISTTEQLRLGYDASNYASLTVTSAGLLVIAPSGGASGFTGTLNISSLTASKPVFTDGSKNLVSTGTVGVTQGGTGTATPFTAGSIVFAGASGVYAQSNAKLFYNDALGGSLGLGTASPSSFAGYGVVTINGSTGGIFELTQGGTLKYRFQSDGTNAYLNNLGSGYTAFFNQSVDRLHIDATGIGIGTTTPRRTLDVLNAAAPQLRLTYTDNLVFADFTVGSGGNLTVAPTGDFIFDPTGNDILPATNYDLNLGALNKKYLTLHAAELWVETLVAQNTIATIGGRVLVGPTTVLTSDLASGATSIVVKHNQMASGDRVYMEANGSVEFMAITSGPSGSGPYTYTVTRNLDGSGANDWSAGDAVFNTGSTGYGFIDLYSFSGVKSGTVGPTIVGNVRNSATYNDFTEAWAIGNLNGVYGYGTNVFGVALGKYAALNSHITIDSGDGIRIVNGTSTVVFQVDLNGNQTNGQVGVGLSNVYISAAGSIAIRNNTTARISLAADGSGFLANSLIAWDASGNLTVTGNAMLGGFAIGSDYIRDAANSFGLASTVTGGDDVRFWAGAAFASRATAPFRLTEAGALVATSATITGTVTATAGAIGGFSVGTDYIRDVANSFGLASTVIGSDDVRFWAGDTFANRATAPFRVTEAGTVSMASGNVLASSGGLSVFGANFRVQNVAVNGVTSFTTGTQVGDTITYTQELNTAGSSSDSAQLFKCQDQNLAFAKFQIYSQPFTNGGSDFRFWGDDSMAGVTIGSNTAPTAMLDIFGDKIRLRTSKTPSSASDTGNAGDVCWDNLYLYICKGTNQWRRVAHNTW